MVFIRKHKIKKESFYQILTEHDNILLDYHTIIYGKNHRLASFESPPKVIKFLVKVIENANKLFITSAESLGCLFTNKTVKIYCTNPVYEQILLKYEEYLRLSVTYEDDEEILKKNNEKYKIISIEEINLEEFKKKIQFIVFNEPIKLYEGKIMAMQPGTFLGWVNYKIKFKNEKTLYYLTSYSEKPRFSTESIKIEADYLIINRRMIKKTNDLEMYSELLRMICLKKNEVNGTTIIIPLPIETLFIEILLHTLSIIQYYKIPIYVVSPLYKKVELLVNIQSEWLNSNVCMNEEPFPIKEYKYLYPVETFNNEYKEVGKIKNKIIFCSDLNYKFKRKKYLKNN